VRRTSGDELLLGEWACLGILYAAPTHGFAIAARLKPTGDVGRVWSLSRALTYRSLDQLAARGFIHPVGEEPGIAGGNRTILAATRIGRSRFRAWIRTPVMHLRDVRSELLLKLVLAEVCEIDLAAMLEQQHAQIERLLRSGVADASDRGGQSDVVTLWRTESARAALRFVDHLRAYPQRKPSAGR
jgi:DNA-binding PadR family transcriptional regulator